MDGFEIEWGWFGGFDVLGKNNNGRKEIYFNAERRLCVDNTKFEHQILHRYTRVARGQDGVDAMSMVNLVLVKNDMPCYV